MRRILSLAAVAVLAVASALSYAAWAQAPRSRLDVVRARGRLICGISGTTVGFSFVEPRSGEMVGLRRRLLPGAGGVRQRAVGGVRAAHLGQPHPGRGGGLGGRGLPDDHPDLQP